jgi:hypothetical protein
MAPYFAALALLALILAAGLAVALVRQQDRHNRYTGQLLATFREERAELLNKVTRPEIPITGRRPTPVTTKQRSPEDVRERARVGTVAPPRSDNGTE